MEKRKWKTIEEGRLDIEKKKEEGWVFPFDWEPFSDIEIERAIHWGITGTTEGTVYFPSGDVQKIKLPSDGSMRVDVLQRLFGGHYSAYDLSNWDEELEKGTILSYNEDIPLFYWCNGVHPKENDFELNENVPEIPTAFFEDYLYHTDEVVFFKWSGHDKKRPPLGGFWGPIVIWKYEE